MAKPMNKAQIVAHLAESTGASKKTVELLLDELFKLAVREVRGKVGTFVIPKFAHAVRKKRDRKPRTGRNPATGAAIKIAAETLVEFRTDTAFAEAVRGDWPGPRRGNYPGPRLRPPPDSDKA
jgi:DNA-binding protein HU-beta